MKTDVFTSGKRIYNIPIELLVILPGKEEDIREDLGNLTELAKSIASQGQLQPIVIRPYKEEGRDVFAICIGKRRRRAVDIANKKFLDEGNQIKKMDCIFEAKGTAPDKRLMADVVSNDHSMPHSDLELGRAFLILKKKYKWTTRQIASECGRSLTWVDNKIELAQSPEHIQKAVSEGSMTATTAKKVIHSDQKTQETARLKIDMGQKVKGKDVDEMKEEKVKPKKDFDLESVMDFLVKAGMRSVSKLPENELDKKFNIMLRISREDPPLIEVLVI